MPIMTLKERLAYDKGQREQIWEEISTELEKIQAKARLEPHKSAEARMKLHGLVRRCHKSGISPVKCMVALMEVQHIENGFAENFGIKNVPMVDGVPAPPKTANLTVFLSEHDSVFLRDDALKASDVLLTYAENLLKEAKYSSLTGTQRQIILLAENGVLEVKEWDGVPCLRLARTFWNDWVSAFGSSQIGLDGYHYDM